MEEDARLANCEHGCAIYQNRFLCECPPGTVFDEATAECAGKFVEMVRSYVSMSDIRVQALSVCVQFYS